MNYYFRYLTLIPVLVFAFLLPRKQVNSTYNKLNIQFKDSLFDMCTVMPGDEVASLSPFGKPIKEVVPTDRFDGYCGCHYDLDAKDDYPQVQIEVNQFASAKASN